MRNISTVFYGLVTPGEVLPVAGFGPGVVDGKDTFTFIPGVLAGACELPRYLYHQKPKPAIIRIMITNSTVLAPELESCWAGKLFCVSILF